MRLAEQAREFAASITLPQRGPQADSLAAEIIPLADAARFLERRANKLLSSRKLGKSGRPLWMTGVSTQVQRVPLGVVLIIGTWNYPLLLTGSQALQALVAGNAVLIKPGRESTAVTTLFKETLANAGLDPELIQILAEDPADATTAIELGVDKLLLTGSAATGRIVQRQLAETLTPSTMELSGCDAMFVTAGANLQHVADAIGFGLRFNNSATCIAPRRVFVSPTQLPDLETRILKTLQTLPPAIVDPTAGAAARKHVQNAIAEGARLLSGDATNHEEISQGFPLVMTDIRTDQELLKTDLFAPVVSLVPVDSMDAALAVDRDCPYALGATVFGSVPEAEVIAQRIDAGSVCVNDVMAPTADPRAPFGGRRQSGFGVTRGAEGLLAMTALKTVFIRHNSFAPHLSEPSAATEDLLENYIKAVHGRNWFGRIRGFWKLLWAGKAVWQESRDRKY